MHGFDSTAAPADLDLAFFDSSDLARERDEAVTRALTKRRAGTPWDAKNQAAVHLWYRKRFGYEVERSARPPTAWRPGPRPRPAWGSGWSLTAA